MVPQVEKIILEISSTMNYLPKKSPHSVENLNFHIFNS